MTVGETIKTLRKKRNMKQEDLAAKLKLSPKTISSWEVNRTTPDIEMLKKICKALKCSPMAFFRE